MFHNLFDGHRDVSVYPVDLNVLYNYFPQYTVNNISKKDLTRRLNNVVFEYLKNIPSLSKKINIEEFQKNFYKQIATSNLSDIKQVVEGLLNSFHLVHEPEKKLFYHLIKETSIELYANELSSYFPNCRFLHLIRDPRDNFAAISSGLDKKYREYGDSKNSLLFSMINRALPGYKIAKLNQKILGNERYQIVKFEDLVSSPVEIMTSICSWLNLPFQECLKTPSILGGLNSGNNFDDLKFNSVSALNVGRWKERIESKDAALIEHFFDAEMDEFGYKNYSSAIDKVNSVNDFYKWVNYRYLYHDRFK